MTKALRAHLLKCKNQARAQTHIDLDLTTNIRPISIYTNNEEIHIQI